MHALMRCRQLEQLTQDSFTVGMGAAVRLFRSNDALIHANLQVVRAHFANLQVRAYAFRLATLVCPPDSAVTMFRRAAKSPP